VARRSARTSHPPPVLITPGPSIFQRKDTRSGPRSMLSMAPSVMSPLMLLGRHSVLLSPIRRPTSPFAGDKVVPSVSRHGAAPAACVYVRTRAAIGRRRRGGAGRTVRRRCCRPTSMASCPRCPLGGGSRELFPVRLRDSGRAPCSRPFQLQKQVRFVARSLHAARERRDHFTGRVRAEVHVERLPSRRHAQGFGLRRRGRHPVPSPRSPVRSTPPSPRTRRSASAPSPTRASAGSRTRLGRRRARRWSPSRARSSPVAIFLSPHAAHLLP